MSEYKKSPTRLYRDKQQGRILGVCAGIADYFGFNPGIVRLLTIIACFIFPMITPLTYFVLGFVLDDKPLELSGNVERDKFWRSVRTTPSDTVVEIKHKFFDLEQRLRNMEKYVTSKEFQFDRDLKQ